MADPRDPNEIEDPDFESPDEGTDAGQIDDESGDDAQAGQELEGDQAEERVRPSRRDDQTREELRALREHNARVESELAQIRAERQQRQQPQEESDEQFNQRTAHLDPEQRMELRLARATRKHERLLALATFASADRADKTAYDAQALVNPIYKKHAQAVEQVMADARRRGIDIDRVTALDFVLGRERRTSMGKVSPAQQQAQRRVQSQQARTTGGRGDQPREPQRARRYAADDRSPEAVRQRLEAPDAFI